MLSFNSFWKMKGKNLLVDTKSSNLPPVEVLEPPVDNEQPTPKNDVPTQVSDYISAKYSGR